HTTFSRGWSSDVCSSDLCAARLPRQLAVCRFYSLYAHVCRADTLQAAWEAVQRNDGAPGVDGESIEQIAASPESEAAFLDELQQIGRAPGRVRVACTTWS